MEGERGRVQVRNLLLSGEGSVLHVENAGGDGGRVL